MTALILVAAGSGTRLAAGVPKALVEVGGRSLVEHCLDTADSVARITETVVVVPAAEVAAVAAGLTGRAVVVVAGGATRDESVRSGLAVVGDEDQSIIKLDSGANGTGSGSGKKGGGCQQSGGDAAPSASFSFNLEGSQQVPPVTTTATGTAVVTINAAETEIKVDITFSNLSGITAAHIHEGASGATGGPIFTLASAAFTSPFTKTLTASDFAASGSVTTFAQAIAAIKAGNTYINIHTSTNASGEIRGQVKNP